MQKQIVYATLLACFMATAVVCSAATSEQPPVEIRTSVLKASRTRATIYAAGQTALLERSFPIRVPIIHNTRSVNSDHLSNNNVNMYTITVEQVSNFIQEDSLSFKLEYDKTKVSSATILDYSVTRRRESSNSQLITLRAKIQELERKKNTINLSLARLRKANQMLETSVSTFAANGKGESIDDKLEVYLTKSGLNDAKIIELESEISQLDKSLASINTEIQEELQRQYNEIKVNVRIEDAAAQQEELDLVLTVMYQVSQVEWSPNYMLKIDSAKLTGSLEFGTSIIQNSGEDWKSAKITLSTAKPSSGGSPPTVLPTHVSLLSYFNHYNRGTAFGGYSASSAAPMLQKNEFDNSVAEGFTADAAYLRKENVRQNVQLKQADSSSIQKVTKSEMTDIVTYEIAQEMNIYSRANTNGNGNQQGQQAKIATITLDAAEFEHIAVPSQTQQVFMKIKAKNTSKMPLMRGSMNIVIDQQLVAKTELAPSQQQQNDAATSGDSTGSLILPGMAFETFVGADSSVTVVAEPMKKKTQVVGSLFTFNRRNAMTNSRDVVITNKKSIPINITIIDSIPSSTNTEQIQVYLQSPLLRVGSSLSNSVPLHELFATHNKLIQNEKEANGQQKQQQSSGTVNTEPIVNCVRKSSDDKSSQSQDGKCSDLSITHPEKSVRVSLDNQYIIKQSTVLPSKTPKTFKLKYTVEYELDQSIRFN